jgi:hypothetical protein
VLQLVLGKKEPVLRLGLDKKALLVSLVLPASHPVDILNPLLVVVVRFQFLVQYLPHLVTPQKQSQQM